MSLRNNYYSRLFNGKLPRRDSGYGASNETNFVNIPRNSSSSSLIFSMSCPNDTLLIERKDFSDESTTSHAETTQHTTIFPATYVKGFMHGGIEIFIPGCVHDVYKPPEGMKVKFRLPQKGDTEETDVDVLVKAGWKQIDYYRDRIEKIQRNEPVPSSSLAFVSLAYDWINYKGLQDVNRLYSDYFNGADSKKNNNAETESYAGRNSNLSRLFGGDFTTQNRRPRLNTL